MKKTYYVWQMKQECFEKLTLRAYGMNQESSEAKESSCVDLSDYDLTCVVVREGDILENLEQLYLLGYMISDKMPLRVENYVFYSIDELIAEVQYLSKKNKTELVRLGKLLVPGDGTLSKSFMGWLLAHNKQDEIEKWEKSLS